MINKNNYNDIWPFKNTDSVILEKSNDGCLFVVIDKMVYALNGLAEIKYDIPLACDYKETYKGRSLDNFFKIAEEL